MEDRKKRGLKAAALCAAVLLAAAPAFAARISRMRYLMGTLLSLEVEAAGPSAAEEAARAVFAEVARWDEILSNYKSDSEISRLNRGATPGAARVSADLFSFLESARGLARMSRGAFDPTVEPLSRLWHLRQRTLASIPGDAAIAEARERVGYGRLELDAEKRTARFGTAGMGLDTGGLGKGFALDAALARVRALPVDAITLNFGGEILFWERNGAERRFDLRDPLEAGALWGHLVMDPRLESAALSTSGNYERFVALKRGTDGANGEGKKLGHILNPFTGRPVENEIRSVTVLSTSAAEADAFSTAIFVMGLEEGKKFSEEMKHCGTIILYEKEGRLESYHSAGLDRFVRRVEIEAEKEAQRWHR